MQNILCAARVSTDPVSLGPCRVVSQLDLLATHTSSDNGKEIDKLCKGLSKAYRVSPASSIIEAVRLSDGHAKCGRSRSRRVLSTSLQRRLGLAELSGAGPYGREEK